MAGDRVERPQDLAPAVVPVANNGFLTGAVLDIGGGVRLAP